MHPLASSVQFDCDPTMREPPVIVATSPALPTRTVTLAVLVRLVLDATVTVASMMYCTPTCSNGRVTDAGLRPTKAANDGKPVEIARTL